MPAQEEVPDFPSHTVPLAHDLTNLSRVLLQALASVFGNFHIVRKKSNFIGLEIEQSILILYKNLSIQKFSVGLQ